MSEAANPYHYGTPVAGDQFVGRSAEIAAIRTRIREHVSVVLLSPRRYGKTSILLRIRTDTARTASIAYVNLFRCRDRSALAAALATSAFHAPGAHWHRGRQAVPEFLRRLRLRPSVTIGDDGRPSFAFSSTVEPPDLDIVLADVFGLLGELAERRPTALMIDEFQALLELDPSLPAALKGLLDGHPGVSVVASGSKAHLMEELFLARNAPLYNMAEHIALGPIPDDQMRGYLRKRAGDAGKPMSEATAEVILRLAGPVPDDIQHLAFEAFEAGRRARVIDDAHVRLALSTVTGRTASLYRDLRDLLPTGQRRVLEQLALAPTSSPTGAEFVRRTGLANHASVTKALRALLDDGLVVVRDGVRTVADPFFAAWLREPTG